MVSGRGYGGDENCATYKAKHNLFVHMIRMGPMGTGYHVGLPESGKHNKPSYHSGSYTYKRFAINDQDA